MQRDGERVAQPQRARQQQRGVAAEEEQRDIGAPGGVQHQDGQKRQQRRKPEGSSPLAGRDPDAARGQEQRDNGKAGGIPDVLAVDPQQKFGGNRDGAGGGVQPWLVRPQQQAQRQSG